MIEEALKDVYRIEVPIPRNPLKATNCYVIKGKDRDLVIDTGMNIRESLVAIKSAFGKIGVIPEKSDFFITHLHADHLGLISLLAAPESTVYFNRPDTELIIAGGRWEISVELFMKNGFPVETLHKAFKDHPGYRYASRGNVEFTIVADGDEIKAGDYNLKVIETPGHTNGHTCLYEPDKKLLFSGDHVLQDITPNIAQWFYDENPLSLYLDSLNKIREYDVELVLPGHRRPFNRFRERIDELKTHHIDRSDEILKILEEGRMSGFEIASGMTWDLTYKNWDLFPIIQKMFATGEAIAHLSYLSGTGKVKTKLEDGLFIYTLD